MKHKHEWTALYWHFGPYGDQDVHVHSCFGCRAFLIGLGRACAGYDGWLPIHWEQEKKRASVSGPRLARASGSSGAQNP